MSNDKNDLRWWQIIIIATVVAGVFAAIPFWTVGLSLQTAGIIAMVIFPVVFGFFFAAFRGWI
jgi:hypothetical protein